MKELVVLTIQTADLSLFVESLNLLSTYYICCRDISNAFYIVNLLRLIGDYTRDYKLKIKALIQLALAMKQVNMISES